MVKLILLSGLLVVASASNGAHASEIQREYRCSNARQTFMYVKNMGGQSWISLGTHGEKTIPSPVVEIQELHQLEVHPAPLVRSRRTISARILFSQDSELVICDEIIR